MKAGDLESKVTLINSTPQRKLKIAFIDYVLEPDKPGRSGLSDIVWDMASELVKQGHEAHIVASYHTKDYPDPGVIVHNFKTPPIGYRNVIGHFLIIHKAARLLAGLKPDIIHTPEYVSSAVLARSGIKTPLVFTTPGNIYHRLQYGHGYEWYYVQILKWAANVSARECARIIAISKEMKYWWEKTGCKPEHTIYLPYGVDTHRFRYLPGARKLLGLDPCERVFLYSGRFSPEKGLLDLLEAIHQVNNEPGIAKYRLVLIGKGPLEAQMRKKITRFEMADKVLLIPWVSQEQLSLWYSAADAFVLPSYSEGFSRTIPEAMSCGLPVIGTRITGTEDHIIDGINGFLYETKDISKLRIILLKIINNPIEIIEMRDETYLYIKNNLTWSKIIGQIITNVYIPIVECSKNRK